MARPKSRIQRLPWWSFLVFGSVVYAVLSNIKVFYTPSSRVQANLLNTISMLAVPLGTTLLFFAVIKFVIEKRERRKRRALMVRQTRLGSLRGLSWQEFEQLVGEAYSQLGYRVIENYKGGADGGVDLVMHKNGQTTLVQCKRWKSNRVGVTLVREHLGVITAAGAQNGIVVCSGGFSKSARNFAQKCGITLVDGDALMKLLFAVGGNSVDRVDVAANSSVVCPNCSSTMVKRTARRGQKSGEEFYGCSQYPSCKATIDIE